MQTKNFRNLYSKFDLEGKVTNGVVNAGHPDFATAQAAIEYANNNGYVAIYLPGGTYDPIQPYPNMGIFGEGFDTLITDKNDPGSAVDMSVNGFSRGYLTNVTCRTTSGNNHDAILMPDRSVTSNDNSIAITNVIIHICDNYGINCQSRGAKIVGVHTAPGNTANDDIFLGSNSEGCIVDSVTSAYHRTTTVTNNGTGNVVGDVQ